MKYEKASAEVVLFDNSDVITASAMGEWNQDEIDNMTDENGNKEFPCDGETGHVVKNF